MIIKMVLKIIAIAMIMITIVIVMILMMKVMNIDCEDNDNGFCDGGGVVVMTGVDNDGDDDDGENDHKKTIRETAAILSGKFPRLYEKLREFARNYKTPREIAKLLLKNENLCSAVSSGFQCGSETNPKNIYKDNITRSNAVIKFS